MKNSTLLSIATPAHEVLVSITSQVQTELRSLDFEEGVVHLFILHTTCGLTINENADPDVVIDLLSRLKQTVPWNVSSDRHGEGNSAAHLKSSLLGTSLMIPVQNRQLVLGTWQGIFLAEFDGPRNRKIHLTAIR